MLIQKGSFQILSGQNDILVSGTDPLGIMYGMPRTLQTRLLPNKKLPIKDWTLYRKNQKMGGCAGALVFGVQKTCLTFQGRAGFMKYP